jgi:nitroreductase
MAMTLTELILKRRSIRQFGPQPVSREALARIVDAGRLAASAANQQPLEFIAVDREDLREKIYPGLKFASAIAPAGYPRPGNEPKAYIFTLVNFKVREKMFEYDVGAAMENMALAALAEGLASCWIISMDRPPVAELLGVPGHYRIDAVLALGYPAQESKEEVLVDSVKYWQDEDLTFHVPKRTLASVLHINQF